MLISQDKLLSLVRNNDSFMLRKSLDDEIFKNAFGNSKINLNHTYAEGTTLLFWAAYLGHLEALDVLLSYPLSFPLDVNKADELETTPLYQACDSGHFNIVKSLIEKRDDEILLDKPTKQGNTPLHVAAYNGHAQIVKYLLIQGARSTAINKQNMTPVDAARANKQNHISAIFLGQPKILTPIVPYTIKTSFISSPTVVTKLVTTLSKPKPAPIVTIAPMLAPVLPTGIGKTADNSILIYKIYLDSDKYFGIDVRLEKIKSALEIITTKINTAKVKSSSTTNCIDAILLAPEYFFSKKSSSKIITRDDKIKIETELSNLSKIYKNILIIPGTFSWAKPGKIDVNRDDIKEEKKSKEIYDEYKENKIKRGITNYKGFEEFKDSRINQTRSTRTIHYLNKLNNEKYKLNHKADNKIFSDQVKLFDQNKMMNSWIIVNATKIYLSGKEVFKYHKYANFHEEDELKTQIFLPGQCKNDLKAFGMPLLTGELRNGKKLKIGIEICFDHYNSVGKTYWKETPDLHVILSDAIDNYKNNFSVKENGFIIHVSTSSMSDSIFQKKSTNFSTITENTEYNLVKHKSLIIKSSTLNFPTTTIV